MRARAHAWGIALALGTLALGGEKLEAQTGAAAATPEETASTFLAGVRGLRWASVAASLHPETLERFATLVSMIAEADSTDGVGRFLTRAAPDERALLGAEVVFGRAIGAMLGEMPGLAHALQDREDAVVGAVAEGADLAHAVYRTQARIGGSVPEVKVIELARAGGGWRVQWSDELEVLDAALRGIAMGPREDRP